MPAQTNYPPSAPPPPLAPQGQGTQQLAYPSAAPVYLQRPAAPAPSAAPAAAVEAPDALTQSEKNTLEAPLQLIVYSHSTLFYWWPVWAVGFLMGILSYSNGEGVRIGADLEWFHPSSNLGIVFFFTLFLVILITNLTVRGLASALVILGLAFCSVLFAYMGWWDPILRMLGNLNVHLNSGAYFTISTMIFTIWALSFFLFDRMVYWRIKPGQVTQERLFGAGSKSYDTEGIALEKHRDDLFRHWLLGLGSGDLEIQTAGANRDRFDVRNVLFIGRKIGYIQRMISQKPD